jgi:hypothetical protein
MAHLKRLITRSNLQICNAFKTKCIFLKEIATKSGFLKSKQQFWKSNKCAGVLNTATKALQKNDAV